MASKVRALARHGVLDALAAREKVAGSAPRQGVTFAYLHSIAPRDIDRFRDLVQWVVENFRVISYHEAVQLARTGEVLGPTLCFSFDDAFANNVTASHVLDSFGISACFFVPTGFVGCDSIEGARRFFGRADGVDDVAMTWDQLTKLVERGHEVGSHTHSHRMLGGLSAAEVVEEIGESREVLVSRLGSCRHFAWPLGQFHHASRDVPRAAFATGHESCASAVRGRHVGQSENDLCIRREHLMVEWPLRHSRHFLTSSRATDGSWPTAWEMSHG